MSAITYPNQHGLVTESYWYAPLEYDVSNRRVLAQFDGCGGISKYSVAGEWSVLSDKRWFNSWMVNGKRLPPAHKKKVFTLGRLLEADFDSARELDGVSVRVQQYTGNGDNELYVRFEFVNEGEKEAKLFLRHGMFWEFGSHMSAMVAKNGAYTYRKPHSEWNEEKTVWEAELAEGFRMHVVSSHPAARVEAKDHFMTVDYEDTVQPGCTVSMVVGISGGAEPKDSGALLANAEAALEEAKAYGKWLSSRFAAAHNPLLNSLFASCLNVSHSSYKESGDVFKAFYAGVNYQSPSRTYFRDGYWTVLPILPFKPDWVRGEILTLSYGIGEDGSCPSAVIYNFLKKQFEAFWSDHYDSPSFFIMMVHDYLAWTHDRSLLEASAGNRTMLEALTLCMKKMERHTDDELMQLVKPDNRHDWCDNVVRQGFVAYDALLLIRARECYAEIMRFVGNDGEASVVSAKTAAMTTSLRGLLWSDETGYRNYRNSAGELLEEANVSIEQALAAVYGIGTKVDQEAVLDILSGRLETRHNQEQPHGDWGVMAVYPMYSHAQHLVEKSAYPFRYHNGSDWPYLSGIFAWAKLKHNRTDWEYPLTRWFTYSLEQQWLTPVEYYDPVFGRGSSLQGWSSMPAAAMLFGGLGLYPELNKELTPKAPPWGDCEVRGIYYRGARYDCIVKDGMARLELSRDGGDFHS